MLKGAGGMISNAANATSLGVAKTVANRANTAGDQVRKVGQPVGRGVSVSAEGVRQLGGKMVRLGRKSAEVDPGSTALPGQDS